MLNAMRSKLKSRRGASITFALLLFLVCSTVSVIVIVAATAASGRMSQTAQTDQRYYAVTSAAELLRTAIDGQTVSVVKTETKTTVTPYTNGVAGDSVETQGDLDWKYYTADVSTLDATGLAAKKVPDHTSLFLTGIAYELVQGTPTAKTATWALTAGGSLSLPEGSSVKPADALAALAVSVYEEQEASGEMTFYVSRKQVDDTTGKKAYTLKLTFAPDVQTSVTSQVDHGAPVVSTQLANVYTVTDIETVTTTTVIKWSLIDISKSTVPDKFTAG